jgi:hypothetical protein
MVLPLDLGHYDHHLAERHLAGEAQRPYLVRWVRRFLQSASGRADLKKTAKGVTFLNSQNVSQYINSCFEMQSFFALSDLM